MNLHFLKIDIRALISDKSRPLKSKFSITYPDKSRSSPFFPLEELYVSCSNNIWESFS